MPLTPVAPRSLGSFYQNVVWIQFSTIVSQTVAFYSVSTDDVNFLWCWVVSSTCRAPLQ